MKVAVIASLLAKRNVNVDTGHGLNNAYTANFSIFAFT